MGSKDLKSLTNASAYCKAESGWHKEDEILDDSWVQQSRKKGPATSHLNGLNWEVLVVNELDVNAFWLPGGKIVVYTGLLEHFKSDAEIATIIRHEVGHALARHTAEYMTKNLWNMQTAVGVSGGEAYTDGITAPPLINDNVGDSGLPIISSLNCPPFIAVEQCREHLVCNERTFITH
ncbi:uncharacterized protein LOC107479310 [Arachis duranensis]|uniref:Uncharacterized protein LOC107479310 n=1 Tax=Arachis duranensis TaxID=130453 RepID=A0A9C6TU18_ARADU|nr:uncharacterized protein LOC107479310 [Arachis duranensis]